MTAQQKGQKLEEVGKAISALGCLIMLLPFAVGGIFILVALVASAIG